MFWGMTLEPGKLYTETMGEEVQLSMAAIDSRKDLDETPSTNFCQIVIQTEKGEYVLCTLVHGVMFQQNLDLKLMPREKVTFSVQGPSVVYLVGYTASYPEDEEDMQSEGYEEDTSAWESFQEGEGAVNQIKEEPVEVLNDSDTDVETDNKAETQGQIPEATPDQTEGTLTEESLKESAEEIIFPVAALDPAEVKAEPPDPEPGPPVTSEVMAPSVQQLPPQDDLYGAQTTDHGISLPQTTTSEDFFYPETQQQSDIPPTPPAAFQPMPTGAPGYQNPQTGALPPAQTFIQTQNPAMQRVQASPIRHPSPGAGGNVPPVNNQRTYPPQRRQYGTVRGKSPVRGRGRGAPPQQQNRNMQQQQSVPGTSQQNIPGPSTSGSPLSPVADRVGRLPLGNSPLGNDSLASSSGFGSSGQKAPSSEAAEHSKSTTKSMSCKSCGKQFSVWRKYKKHLSYHSRSHKFPCSVCGKGFMSMANLAQHGRVHTGDKPFKCRVCGRRFAQKGTWSRHEETH